MRWKLGVSQAAQVNHLGAGSIPGLPETCMIDSFKICLTGIVWLTKNL